MKNAGIISVILLPLMTGCGGNSQAGKKQPMSYSGNLYEIHNSEYSRMIFAKSTTEKYLIQMITEFGEMSGNEEFQLHSFWFGKSGDWHIIKVGETIDFYTYHNLVGWLKGYDKNPNTPKYSIGFSLNKIESSLDYIFYLDPNAPLGDREIGTFRNGKSFFIYLPEAFEEFGNLTITENFKLSWNDVVNFISKNGLNISKIESLNFIEHKIKMNE